MNIYIVHSDEKMREVAHFLANKLIDFDFEPGPHGTSFFITDVYNLESMQGVYRL